MFRSVVLGLFATALCGTLLSEPSRGEDQLVSIELHNRRPLVAEAPSKLSPALQAIRDAGGVLRGADLMGNPVIAVPPTRMERFRASASVRTMMAEVPANYLPVKRLKLSYAADRKPTEQDLRNLGVRLVEDYSKGSFLVVEPLTREIDAGLAGKLENTATVRYATPMFLIKAIPPTTQGPPRNGNPPSSSPPTDDPGWTSLCDSGNGLWGMKNIHAPIAWGQIHDSNVVVAVIDTGVDYTHEDLKANIWSDSNGKHGYDFVENDDDPMDMNSHGTHCSGTVGAVGNNHTGVVGVNWKVKIMAVRWLDAGGSGDVVNAIKAIDFAVDNGAKVLSNSWFWPEDDPDLEAAIQRADDNKVLFLAAAGNFALRPNNNGGDNDNPSTYGRYPSSYPLKNIIAVAAIDMTDGKASFSEWGKTSVDIGAPGVNILSTVPHNDYDCTFSGTSMATPHVAGSAALTMARYPARPTPRSRITCSRNARPIDALRGRCVSNGTLDISFLGNSH